MKEPVRYACIGAAAGLVNGMMGTGGGMLLVPLLTRCGVEPKKAMATSVAVILPLCILSVWICRRSLDANWTQLLPYLGGGLIGGITAGLSFGKVPSLWMRRMFALLLLYGGIRAVFF